MDKMLTKFEKRLIATCYRKNHPVRKVKGWKKMDKRPVHMVKASLFSTTSGFTNYWGFFNLAILLLVSFLL
jgi:hypothetical protein